MTRRDSIWKSLDWVTIVVYLLLIVFGWFSVCGASYDYGDRDFLDFSTRAGKQFVWIICSFGLGFVLLMLDDSLYDMFSYWKKKLPERYIAISPLCFLFPLSYLSSLVMQLPKALPQIPMSKKPESDRMHGFRIPSCKVYR